MFAQALGQQGADTNTGTGRDRDHQVLHGEGERNRIERILAQLGNKNAVYYIV